MIKIPTLEEMCASKNFDPVKMRRIDVLAEASKEHTLRVIEDLNRWNEMSDDEVTSEFIKYMVNLESVKYEDKIHDHFLKVKVLHAVINKLFDRFGIN